MAIFPSSSQRLVIGWRILLFVAAISLGARADAQGAGYWHTRGNRILDESNKQVRIAGISWYGFETPAATPGGLNAQDYKTILRTVKAQGFNTVRIPLSSQMIETPSSALSITYSNAAGPMNTDLQGLNSLEVLDRIVAYSGSIGLKVILDHHRSEAGSSAEASGLWYTAAYPESAWIADWTALAIRYLGNPTVIGFDLHNEPHSVKPAGACWDCGGANDWHLAAEHAGNAVLAANPHLLVFVEGVDAYNGDFYWWGGNLEGVQKSPVVLAQPNHLVYSAHEYGPKESAQTWFNASTTYSSLTASWSKHWAYISQTNLAPVWLGEFGSTNSAEDLQNNAPGSQGQWFQSLVAYLNVNENISWSYWAVNGEDSYAILDGKYGATPASDLKESMLSSLSFPLATATRTPASPRALTANVVSTSQIDLNWMPVSGSDVTYNVYFGTNPANIGTLVAAGVKANAVQATNLNCCEAYYFAVKAVSDGIASAPSNEVSATTQTQLPSIPSALTSIAQSAGQMNLAWLAVAAAGIGYTVYNGTSANNLGNVVASGLDAPRYQIANLKPSTIRAFLSKPVATPAPAAVKASSRPAPPKSLLATVESSAAVNLAWQPSATPGVVYNVYGSTTPGGMGSLLAGGVDTTSYQATRLNAMTTYFFTVRAVVSGFTSPASNSANATTAQVEAMECLAACAAAEILEASSVAEMSLTNIGGSTLASSTSSQTLPWTPAGNDQATQNLDGIQAEAEKPLTLSSTNFHAPNTWHTMTTGIGFQAAFTRHSAMPAAFFLNGLECL